LCPVKIALVSSVGGHLTELRALAEGLEGELVWVVNDESPVLPTDVSAYRIAHAERDLLVLWNLVEVAAIFARERPDLMLSMGAGPAVPAAIVAKLAGIPVVYVEPSSAVKHLTLTGRLMRHLSDAFYVQWRQLQRREAPWARYVGGLL
jgi:UDP-N-acetylglucosamine:LPS N-acetylglucosamine transferase